MKHSEIFAAVVVLVCAAALWIAIGGLIVALIGCGEPVAGQEFDSRLSPLLDEYMADLSQKGILVDSGRLKGMAVVKAFSLGGHRIGQCEFHNSLGKVSIDERALSWYVVYHELAHCLNHIDHVEDPDDLMSPVLGHTYEWYEQNREGLVNKLAERIKRDDR